jgi:hypothetical protein
LWRILEPFLAEAQDDATIMAIKLQAAALILGECSPGPGGWEFAYAQSG